MGFMTSLSEKSYEEIKIFLTKYCLHHKSSGYNLLPDPLSTYYEALCVGLDLSTGLNDEPHPNLGALSPNVEQEAEAEVGVERAPKNTVAIQRERVGKMTLVDFTDYFHLPIEDAAKK
ncbi:hypothetical protein L6164_024465 [Bauhinia variegata]|uniref:Uncharacterized protein n=1 Tax=Bauhinia variegata TaxID=167791 RepID=A0ACB9M055_BAUVA|nr:hypothetical protein L6164_024465 [Bauhinia variegata]